MDEVVSYINKLFKKLSCYKLIIDVSALFIKDPRLVSACNQHLLREILKSFLRINEMADKIKFKVV